MNKPTRTNDSQLAMKLIQLTDLRQIAIAAMERSLATGDLDMRLNARMTLESVTSSLKTLARLRDSGRLTE